MVLRGLPRAGGCDEGSQLQITQKTCQNSTTINFTPQLTSKSIFFYFQIWNIDKLYKLEEQTAQLKESVAKMKVLYDELHEFDNAVSDFEIILGEF